MGVTSQATNHIDPTRGIKMMNLSTSNISNTSNTSFITETNEKTSKQKNLMQLAPHNVLPISRQRSSSIAGHLTTGQ